MQMKLLDHKKYLIRLNNLVKEKGHHPSGRTLSVLTADAPIGYGSMSHQTIATILKGSDVKFSQLQELARVLEVKINQIISDNIIKTEIIEKFDYEKSHFVPRNYDEPIEVIYFLNNAYLKPTQKALFWPIYEGNGIPAFSLIDFDHKNWINDKKLKERLINVDVFVQRKLNNMFYLIKYFSKVFFTLLFFKCHPTPFSFQTSSKSLPLALFKIGPPGCNLFQSVKSYFFPL